MKRDEAYEPFKNIKARLEEIAESLGLECHRVSFNVDDDYLVHVVWTVKAEAVMSEAEKEQLKIDREFDLMTKSFEDPLDEKINNSKSKIQELLQGFQNKKENEEEE